MPRERLNPSGLFKHPYFTRILKVRNPATIIFMAGHTPADENYQPVHPGDLRGRNLRPYWMLFALGLRSGACGTILWYSGGCTLSMYLPLWRSCAIRIFLPWHPDRPSPSTLIGVTALSNAGFLLRKLK